jgi:DNA primase
MHNPHTLKAQVDVRQLVEDDLGPSACRGGAARLWRCPFHKEQHGYSLAVWVDGWRCFGACQTSGDALDWLQRYRGLTFPEACEYLEVAHSSGRIMSRKPPNADWQVPMKRIVDRAATLLWSPDGERALQYLKKRGLTEETITRARLGYVPGYPWEWLTIGKLAIPCGLVIPWFVGQELWTVKVRRAIGRPKYTHVAGGSTQGLYHATHLEGHEAVLLVEGEFDALLAEQECGGIVGVATLGSATRTLSAYWLPLLLHCKTLLIAYDADEAGMKGAARLQALTRRARVIQVPWGKDITEFVLKGGSVQRWLNENL